MRCLGCRLEQCAHPRVAVYLDLRMHTDRTSVGA